jgi:putative thioredoxin
VLAKVNVDNNQRLAQAFGVQGIPAVKAVFDGKLINEFTGVIPESQVRAWLKKFVPASPEQEAADLVSLEASDPQTAEQQYRQLLAKDPTQDDSRLGLGRLLIAAQNPEGIELLRMVAPGTSNYSQAQAWIALAEYMATVNEEGAFDLLAQIDANPADLEARYQLAAHYVKGRTYAQATEQLLEIIARSRSFREDAARKVLVALFNAIEDQNPLVVAGRKRLANLLF